MTSDNKTNLKADQGQHNKPHKRGLLLSFIIFMAWVIGIGLLLSLIACQPTDPKILVIKEGNK